MHCVGSRHRLPCRSADSGARGPCRVRSSSLAAREWQALCSDTLAVYAPPLLLLLPVKECALQVHVTLQHTSAAEAFCLLDAPYVQSSMLVSWSPIAKCTCPCCAGITQHEVLRHVYACVKHLMPPQLRLRPPESQYGSAAEEGATRKGSTTTVADLPAPPAAKPEAAGLLERWSSVHLAASVGHIGGSAEPHKSETIQGAYLTAAAASVWQTLPAIWRKLCLAGCSSMLAASTCMSRLP